MKMVNLYCLPYAGGTATIYRKHLNKLDSYINLQPIELAGRGARFNEPLIDSIENTVEDIYSLIKTTLDPNVPYALLGYSMGSLITYELYYKIKQLGHQSPVHIFFCAKEAPNIPVKDKWIHKLDDNELIKEIMPLGGISEEVLKNREILELYIPIIRADYKVVETYKFNQREMLIDCDITVINGKNDYTHINHIYEWEKMTKGKCTFDFFDGGHFFINNYNNQLAEIVSKTLKL